MDAHKRPTSLAQLILRQQIRPGDTVVDATAGNGRDTVFLAEAVGETGRVLAFDIQAAAIEATRARLTAAGLAGRVELIRDSHARLGGRVGEGGVAAVMFNLGYLPGADHGVVTDAVETLAALAAAARALRPGGILSVVCYPGHAGGDSEAAAVDGWLAARAGEGWVVTRHCAVGTRRPAPFLLLGTKPATSRSGGP
jgi:tRNA A58 N-methylase Trm61